ncbi:hypothetical protein [Candidatus Villigracilis affinis]|uniref:hypothetical protein n=1 Tax=Candidatus Villigracilis affinis TaxID=3140682 RepID=UPI002A22C589|nr:hypothetical protein [Anaerolineales bacterium]
MKNLLRFFLPLTLIACAPATEAIPDGRTRAAACNGHRTPPTATLEPQSFFKVFGEEPIVSKGESGTWDDRYTDPGAVVFYDGVFHMFRNGFRGYPAESQVGCVTSTDG